MRFRIPQDLLDEGLRTVGRAFAGRSLSPAVGGVYLRAAGAELELRATDLELTVHKRVPAEVDRAGHIALPARHLSELMRRLPPGELTVEVDERNMTARILGSDCEYVAHGWPGEQYPALQTGENLDRLGANAAALRALLREVSFATGHDESRPFMTGVAFTVKGATATAMASNGAVLAYGQFEVENPADVACSVILPGRSVQELVRLLGEEEGACDLLAGRNQFQVRLGSATVQSALLDGVYPDWLRLLPQAYPSSVSLERERLLAACERAALVAAKGAIQLEARADGLHLLAVTPEVGRVSERVSAALTGPEFTVPLNVEYVLAGLKAAGHRRLTVEFASQQSAVRFRGAESDRSFFAVLPLLRF